MNWFTGHQTIRFPNAVRSSGLAADGIGNTENIFFIYWQARRDKKDSPFPTSPRHLLTLRRRRQSNMALGIVAMPGRGGAPYEIA
jgi:hypothetical protein